MLQPRKDISGYFGRNPVQPNPVQPHMDAYSEATRHQGGDYDDIMSKFRDTYNQAGYGAGNQNLNFDITLPAYESTSDYKDSISNLGGLAKTGGYSPDDIANIRARSVSPIRAVYQNAARNLSRQRSLQGGYSPNYAAATSKMAREQSSLASDAMTNVNAQIAQDVTRNRLSASVPYASTTAGEQQSRNDFAQRNADTANKYGFAKAENAIKEYELPSQMRLSALKGMTDLYGTTPASTALMQKGALGFSDLQNTINQQNKTADINTAGKYVR